MSPASVRNRQILQFPRNPPKPPRKLNPLSPKGRMLKCFPFMEESSISVKELTRSNINWYRLSFYENICINILQAGYHRTYAEMFNLVEMQKELRERAGAASFMWSVTPLSQRKDQLQFMSRLLINAENAMYEQNYDLVYRINLAIAHYFRANEEDRWLVKYFLCKCYGVANNTLQIVRSSSAKQETTQTTDRNTQQATQTVKLHQNEICGTLIDMAKQRVLESSYHILAFLYETGEYTEALETARNLYNELKNASYYRLAPSDPAKENDPEWLANAPPLRIVVCEQLCKSMIKLIESDSSADTVEDRTGMLMEALDFATESENEGLIGTCKLHICEEYERQNALDQALKYAEEYYQLAKRLDDLVHRIQACKAMARIYQRLSDLESAQIYLDELAKLEETCEDPYISADVARILANFHVTQSQDYAKAHEFAESGFHTALRARTSQLTCNMLRVWCGLAKGAELQPVLIPTVVQSQHDERTMGALLNWRSFNVLLPPIANDQFLEKTRNTFSQRMQQLRTKPVSTST